MINQVQLTIIIWTLSGIAGIVVRIILLHKYAVDLRVSQALEASAARQAVSKRGIQTSVFHILAKLCVVAIGIAAWLQNPAPAPQPLETWMLLAQAALIAIPWLLTLDGISEYRFQKWLLTNGLPMSDASRLMTSLDDPKGGK